MRSSNQSIGADTDAEGSTSTGANIGPGQSAVMQAACRGEHAPRHGAGGFYAKIEAQAIDMADVIFRRSVVWIEATLTAKFSASHVSTPLQSRPPLAPPSPCG